MNRAMKPPGGDCHDLFGVSSYNGSPCHNRVLKPPGGGSSDIFGSPEPPASHAKTRNYDQQSLIGTVMNGTKSPTDSTPSSTTSSTDGNPVTGDGYESSPVKEARSSPSTVPDSKPRGRVPPGGYSSGLW